ncbi:MAG: DUF4011 domain-containing protein [Deltaproteobacteria bacterium]|nr:DUF4011 domain-containing protein [Deltaproteobacteria bacterium]
MGPTSPPPAQPPNGDEALVSDGLPVALHALDVEGVRFAGERDAARALRADASLAELILAASSRQETPPDRIRRELMARSVMLTEGMARSTWDAARSAARTLGVTEELEIFQAAGAENAAIHLSRAPVFLEIRGRLLALLDQDATTAVFGHELGHYLAHGPGSPDAELGLVAQIVISRQGAPEHAVARASALAMAREITADRFGLLAVQDLDAALRLEMAVTTGLASSELSWDTGSYLAQCRALIEGDAGKGERARGLSHPEHGLRAWAVWLFSESDRYRDLTGRGPGTRPLAEVDRAIVAALGTAPTEGLVEASLALDPIPEVHECALAAAVLVALADGEIAEEEALAIERIFAPLVPDWQRYLVWDNAMEAFYDTGAVVIRGGVRVQRSVFQVLIHVLAADGQVLQSEIEMTCSIGDALQCGTLFRAMLSPVLIALGAEVPDLEQIDRPIPMPARADEAHAALRVFLQGVARRGGGSASPRRMFQLLGDREGTQASREIIAQTLDAAGLVADQPLDEASLDQPLALALTAAAAAARAAQAPPPPLPDEEPARARLAQALVRLRDQLVSGDGRSPSIRLRAPRTGRSLDLHRLEVMSVGHASRALTLVQGRERARLVDGKEVGVHEGAEAISRELVALEREALLRQEQTGARDLFVGAPFLTGVFHGYLVRAPLILYPVDLVRSQGRGFALTPREGDEPVANQALVRLLFSKKGVSFPDDLGEQLDAAAAEGQEAMRDLLGAHALMVRPEGDALKPLESRDEAFATWPEGRMVLEPCAALGFFPQSSSDMIQDYDELLAAIADPAVDVGERLGTAGPLLPAELREALGVQSTLPPSPAPVVPVVAADPTQREVLHRAREARTLVVDGPPGTGKSQVIVNLVADALAQGQSVAVVCEKRAALDVVAQRLDQIGLAHLFAQVHDIHQDRRPLYDQVIKRLNELALRDADQDALRDATRELAAVTEALRGRREALASAVEEGAPTLGQLHLLASSYSAPALSGLDPSVVRLSLRDLRRLAGPVSREARAADLHREGSPWRAPAGQRRPPLSDASPAALTAVEEALAAARDTGRTLDPLRGALREEQVREAAEALRHGLGTAALRADTAGRAAFLSMLRDDPGLAALIAKTRAAWAAADPWLEVVPERARFESSPELETALTVAWSRSDSLLRFLSLAWWRARAVVRAALSAQWPAALTAPLRRPLLGRIRARGAGAQAWRLLDQALAALHLEQVLPDSLAARALVGRLGAIWDATRPLVEAEGRLRAAQAWPEGSLDRWDELLADRLRLVAAAEAHQTALAPARARFPWIHPTLEGRAVDALYEAWVMDAPRAVASDRAIQAGEEITPRARELVEQLADQLPDGGEATWRDALEHGWALANLQLTERRHPEARLLDRPTAFGELNEAEAQLKALIQRRADLFVAQTLAVKDRMPLLTEARPEQRKRRTPLQKAREQMLHEAGKRRNVLSLRGFTRQFSDEGLMELLPVWLLSPETMAVLFPSRPVFDLIVLDEASQCTVESGFPALIRGKRAVVAGDERQMPPSSFFRLSTAGDDDAIGTAETVERDALSGESLLALARERCPHQGLRWHYRCAHEELIAFSNHAMYGAGLLTIPSTTLPDAPPALRWEAVPDGAYDKGGNPNEAARVAALVDELLLQEPPPSIGVVTFNIQQRKIILDALDARAETDADFGRRWSAATTHPLLDQRPFVKNLEAVQGDERDVILFSLGHAPVERRSGPLRGQRYVPARFGPLAQAGGERRLNVAVSRAKRACVVVASFEPSMLSVANSTHEGPRLFKAFLEFAWDLSRGRRLQAQKTLERVKQGAVEGGPPEARRDRLGAPSLAALVGMRLRERGVAFDLDVGTSGFRVPLALRDGDAFRVAVLTDEGEPVGDVEERHHHQPAVLGFRGWRVERVDARAWHRDPEAVLTRLEATLAAATADAEEALAAAKARRAAEAAAREAEGALEAPGQAPAEE